MVMYQDNSGLQKSNKELKQRNKSSEINYLKEKDSRKRWKGYMSMERLIRMKTLQRKKEGRQSATNKNTNRNLSCGKKGANGM